MIKKIIIFISLVFVSSITLLSQVDAVGCPELNPGDVVKAQNGSAVYFITEDLESKYYPNDEVYFTWHDSWDIVKSIQGSCLDLYPLANPAGMTYRPGSRLVKRVESPAIYVILSQGIRSKVADPSILEALYGFAWGTLVRDVPSYNWSNYAKGSDLVSASPHDGQLLKISTRDTTYFVDNGGIYKFDGDLGILAQDIRTVDEHIFTSLPERGQTITKDAIIANLLGTSSETIDTVPDSSVVENPSVDIDTVVIDNSIPSTPEIDNTIPDSPASNLYTLSTLEQETINQLNAYRKANDLGIVVHDDALYELAKEHSQYMYDTDIFEHVGFEDRFNRAQRNLCVENLAWNYQSGYDVVWVGWKNSPGHNVNMLQKDITHIGLSWVGPYTTMFACK